MYDIDMDGGMRGAKNRLLKLVERVTQLIPMPKPKSKQRGRGIFREKIHFYPGWDLPKEDKKIEEMFEVLKQTEVK